MTPDPPAGLAGLVAADLRRETSDDPDVAGWTAAYGAPFGGVLSRILAGSPFLSRLVRRDPARLDALARDPPDASLARLVAAQRAIGEAVASGGMPAASAPGALRRNRDAVALLVALCDIGGIWPVERVIAALSDFADASVESATRIALADAHAARLLAAPPAPDGTGSGLVVLALGKHGAGELNYSSDIDLVVFFDPAGADPAAAAGPVAIYSRVAKTIARLLQERTADGYVHRVDYRLRPDPGSTAIAVSLPAAYSYYESVGQNWERAAFIKARPVAGDRALGRRFLDDLTPFVWRKYFDFAALADIHAMKRQIHALRGHARIAVAGHDIKLGRGGIREIEFFVQTQQLVFGGRRPALRGRRTLDMLDALHSEAWISAEARDDLAAAYRFLREIEHRLQMVSDEQTQRLPVQAADLDRFARFAGYPDAGSFSAALLNQAARVQHHYARLFEAAPELASGAGDLVFTGSDDDPATLATLARLGFRQPSQVTETVRGWHFGRRAAVTSARAREVLTDLVPPLLEALGGTSDPDGALSRLDRAFARMPAAIELLVILRANAQVRLLFADLLGSAPRLAEAVTARPHVLDAIIDPAFVQPARDEDAIEAEAGALIGRPTDMEDALDRMRDAARQLRFVTGARLLSGIVSPREAGAGYAGIARAMIRAALAQVGDAFRAAHGDVPGGRVAVLGLGRLGARDLTVTSDLDLVVVYDFDPAARTSDGPRPLDAAVYYTRLTQRLVAALTAPTRRGRLYDIDLRLRPSGRQGPLATQFSGFVAYHDGEAELWEHMALVRARPVAGDAGLCETLADVVAAILARPRSPARVFAEVAAMRDLVAREKGDGGVWDVKLAPGGLTDLDFLAQALVLAHAHTHRALVGRSAREVFVTAGEAGYLDASDVAILCQAEDALGGVQHWQRLTLGDRIEDLAEAPATLNRLAAAAGAPDPARLGAWLADMRSAVRGIFDRVLRPGWSSDPGSQAAW